MDTARDDDRRLVEKARAGSRDAAETLVDRHWHACWRVARGILGDPLAAEDVVQESLVAALRGLAGFDPARGAFGAWLYRITVNRSLTELRRTRRGVPLDEAPGAPDAPHADDDGFLRAIAGLGPKHRAVIVLRYGLDYTPAEIGAALDLPLGTVASRLSRALETLRQTTEDPRVR